MDCGSTGKWENWSKRLGVHKVLGWRIYYENGNYFCSKKNNIDDLPNEGVQIICIYHTDGKRTYRDFMNGVDEYWLPKATRPKYGKMMKWDEFNRIFDIAWQQTTF